MQKSMILFSIMNLLVLNSFGQFNQSLVQKAENGIVSSQIELAKCYLEGNGIRQSQSEALKWYEKAAERNNIEAMVACGDLLCYDWNIDLEPDYVRGVNWYRKAAAKGNKKARQFLADWSPKQKEEISHEYPDGWLPFYDETLFLSRSETLRENEELIRNYYNEKNPVAAYYLAVLSYLDMEYVQTIKYLTEAYPLVVDEDNYYEDIVELDERRIPIGATIAAKVSSLLGVCYEYGYGVEKDLLKASEYYLYDFDYSCYGMSIYPKVRGCYCLKKAGLYEDFIQKVNSQGSALANVPCLQLEIAEMYKTGDGVASDLKKTLDIYESIVEWRINLLELTWPIDDRSYPDIGRAAYRASIMYKNGEGCKADEDMADLYFEIALKYGDKTAWYERLHK